MNNWLDTWPTVLNSWFVYLATLTGGLQLLTLAFGAGLAWILHRRWQAYIAKHLGQTERRGLWRLTVRGIGRVVFALSMLVLLLIGRFVLAQFSLKTPLLDVVIPLLLSLAAIQITVYILRRAITPGPALRAWEGFITAVAVTLVALHLLGWLPEIISGLDNMAIQFGKTRFSLLSLMKLFIAVAVFLLLARWLSNFIEQRAKLSPNLSPSMRVGLAKTSRFILYTLAVLFALSSVGIDLTSFAVFSGALGVGLGFGLQRIASNFISGFILLFDRSIRPGDVISIGDRFGWVEALHARYIVVRDRDGVETLIPNENLITSEVINWSYSDRHVRVRLPVQIGYQDNPEQAMAIMVDACKVSDRILAGPEPVARLLGFGDNGIELELRLWLADPEEGVGAVKSDVNLEIWRQFQQHGITIPYPQRDVHIIDKQEN